MNNIYECKYCHQQLIKDDYKYICLNHINKIVYTFRRNPFNSTIEFFGKEYSISIGGKSFIWGKKYRDSEISDPFTKEIIKFNFELDFNPDRDLDKYVKDLLLFD